MSGMRKSDSQQFPPNPESFREIAAIRTLRLPEYPRNQAGEPYFGGLAGIAVGLRCSVATSTSGWAGGRVSGAQPGSARYGVVLRRLPARPLGRSMPPSLEPIPDRSHRDEHRQPDRRSHHRRYRRHPGWRSRHPRKTAPSPSRAAASPPVGPSADLAREHTDSEVIDGRGKAVLPGFINSHTHTVLLVLRGTVEDMAGDAIFGYMTPISFAMTPDERAAVARLGCLEGILSGTTTMVEPFRHVAGYAQGHGRHRPAALSQRERRRRPDAEDPPWRLRVRPGPSARNSSTAHHRADRTLPPHPGRPRALPDLGPRARTSARRGCSISSTSSRPGMG